MDDEIDNSRIALKIVFILSLLLVGMDFLEIYFSFIHLKAASLKFEYYVFENCIKYHLISQIVFTLFATFAGISALAMSLGLLINDEYFSSKLLDTFMYSNYLVFGPYLLTACILGYVNFDMIAFNCDPTDITQKYINFTTLLSIVISFLLSIIITMLYSFIKAVRKIFLSITNREGGWKLLGKLFWKYVFTRTNYPISNRIEDVSMMIEDNNNMLLHESLINRSINDVNYPVRRLEEEFIDNRNRNRSLNRRNRINHPASE